MPRTVPPPVPNRARRLALDVPLALGCAALALWVHRGALDVYFHPDDLVSLEWAHGLLPARDTGLWRLLSGRLFFASALGAFGADPRPYHVLNAALHAVNVVLLYVLARRWGAPAAAATLTAGLFGAARPAFSALQQAVGIGDLLAFGLATAALLLGEQRPRLARVAAVALLLAALLSKEAVLLMPLVLLLPRDAGPAARPGAWRARWRAALPLLAVSAVAVAMFAAGHVRERAFTGNAYAVGFGANLFHDLMTYVVWAFDVRDPFYGQSGSVSATAWRVGLPLTAALLALAWATRRRTHLPMVGLAWAGIAIAPVLPLLHHTCANYLYTPQAGLALAVGTGVEALVAALTPAGRATGGTRGASSPFRHTVAVTVVVGVLLAAQALTNQRLLGARLTARYADVDLPLDSQLRKSEMVRRAVAGLRRTSRGAPRRLVIFLPVATSARLDDRTGTLVRDTTLALTQMLMVQVLDDGRALRALFPGLDSVAFVTRWNPGYADFDLCVNAPEGDIEDLGRGPDAHLRLGALLLRGGYAAIAAEHLAMACAAYPQDERLLRLLAAAQAGPPPR